VTSSSQGVVCSDGTSAGYYISIKAAYTNTGIMNGFLGLASLPMTEQATVKVQ
jgi:hypothetical protein